MKQKKVLVLYYTQSGQLKDVAESFVEPFNKAGVGVELVRLKPQADFPFPWTSETFFNAMPETVIGIPLQLAPFQLKEQRYDLVVFAYQPWFLSISSPANSALHHPEIRKALKDTPVVTLIAARNMWLNAQEQAKKLLSEAGAKLVGNVALVDKNSNLVSAVTILYWMMTGKKDRYLGVFPNPGVAEDDIINTAKFGETVCYALMSEDWQSLQPSLAAQGAVEVKSNLMFIEERAPRLFSIWANLIVKRKKRKAWLLAFKYYLLVALFIVAPIVLAINFLFFRVFFLRKIEQKKKYYAGVTLGKPA